MIKFLNSGISLIELSYDDFELRYIPCGMEAQDPVHKFQIHGLSASDFLSQILGTIFCCSVQLSDA